MRESSLLYHPPRNFFFFNEPAQICATCLFMNCFVWKHEKKSLLSIAAERLFPFFMMFVTLFRQPSAVTFLFYEWKRVSRLHETFLVGSCALAVKCIIWRSQGACFAYLPFSQWIICWYSWRSLTRCILRRFIAVSWIRNVIIFRVIATCNLRFFHAFPVDFIRCFPKTALQKNDRFVISTVNVEWTGKWMIYLHFTLSRVRWEGEKSKKKVFHELCRRFSGRETWKCRFQEIANEKK